MDELLVGDDSTSERMTLGSYRRACGDIASSVPDFGSKIPKISIVSRFIGTTVGAFKTLQFRCIRWLSSTLNRMYDRMLRSRDVASLLETKALTDKTWRALNIIEWSSDARNIIDVCRPQTGAPDGTLDVTMLLVFMDTPEAQRLFDPKRRSRLVAEAQRRLIEHKRHLIN